MIREMPCRQEMSSHRTGTIDSKSGTPIPRLPHLQGFVEQEGKGRGGHTCSLSEKDTMKAYASRGDIGSIPLDTYREKARKRRKRPTRSSSKPRGTRTTRQSEKGERMRVPSSPRPIIIVWRYRWPNGSCLASWSEARPI